MDRPYAWVTAEVVRHTDAVRPGHEFSNGERVHQHGDYVPWPHGKRETLRRIQSECGYNYRAARAVARLMGWEE